MFKFNKITYQEILEMPKINSYRPAKPKISKTYSQQWKIVERLKKELNKELNKCGWKSCQAYKLKQKEYKHA